MSDREVWCFDCLHYCGQPANVPCACHGHRTSDEERRACFEAERRIKQLEAQVAEPTYITLNCHCTAPIALRVDQIDHGLVAGWKCDACGQTLMLSDFAKSSEFMRSENGRAWLGVPRHRPANRTSDGR